MNGDGIRKKVKCPDCGNEYGNLAKHWDGAEPNDRQQRVLEVTKNNPNLTQKEVGNIVGVTHSSVSMTLSKYENGVCSRPEITDRQREIITGLLMGDGSIYDSRVGGGNECCMIVSSITKPFLKWVDDEFGVLACGASSIRKGGNREVNGIMCETQEQYSTTLRSHPVFTSLRDKWYGSGEKTYPNDINLTPLITKIWYCSDGSLVWHNKCPRVVFASKNESHRSEFLMDLFREQGFDPGWNQNRVYFKVDDSHSILEWMGEPLPGFEYKWDI